ncbi:GAS8-like protein, putative [Plasmodium ovale wallikeri]|uniref:GAS8-like protein, putative n=1 Tax=Plasmodium ovale wallikeri TaxID=864142 RepID=A0A1A9A1N3_PLAOA|nr:GAS8-like protein, putative [Plasmodium ovale wallikeri]SBT50413.1 GAS8-like protein, putative [Plasmodium ovale wallikeri]
MHNSVAELVPGNFLTMHVPSFFKEEKNAEFECFKKEYNEIKNKIDFISEGCEKYDEKVKEESKIIKHKSVFYNFQNVEELKKLLKEKEEIKILIDEKHEQTMNKLMSYIEEQRINLDYVKNKNFDEINELNSSFDLVRIART